MIQALKAPNGLLIPFNGGWRFYDASYLHKGKPRIFYPGQGWYSYPIKGPDAWTVTELPDPPKEPDRRFMKEEHEAWYPLWLDYEKEYGLPMAAKGLNCCEYYVVARAMDLATQRHRMPPAEIVDPVRAYLGVDPLQFDTLLLFCFSHPFSLDIIALLQRLMRLRGVDFDTWNSTVEQSAKQWITEHYGEGSGEAVEKLLHWKPDQETEQRYIAYVTALAEKQREAINTCKKLK